MNSKDIRSLTKEEIRETFSEMGLPRFRAEARFILGYSKRALRTFPR